MALRVYGEVALCGIKGVWDCVEWWVDRYADSVDLSKGQTFHLSFLHLNHVNSDSHSL